MNNFGNKILFIHIESNFLDAIGVFTQSGKGSKRVSKTNERILHFSNSWRKVNVMFFEST